MTQVKDGEAGGRPATMGPGQDHGWLERNAPDAAPRVVAECNHGKDIHGFCGLCDVRPVVQKEGEGKT